MPFHKPTHGPTLLHCTALDNTRQPRRPCRSGKQVASGLSGSWLCRFLLEDQSKYLAYFNHINPSHGKPHHMTNHTKVYIKWVVKQLVMQVLLGGSIQICGTFQSYQSILWQTTAHDKPYRSIHQVGCQAAGYAGSSWRINPNIWHISTISIHSIAIHNILQTIPNHVSSLKYEQIGPCQTIPESWENLFSGPMTSFALYSYFELYICIFTGWVATEQYETEGETKHKPGPWKAHLHPLQPQLHRL